MRRTIIAATALLLTGCQTSLQTAADVTRTVPTQALSGISYALPMLQYNLEVTYSLSACPKQADPADPDSKAVKLDIAIEAKATPVYVAGERYVIDYPRLSSGMKTTDFVLEAYPNGALKSVNASVQDQTGAFLKSAVQLGGTVAGLLTGNPEGLALAAAADTSEAPASVQLAAAEWRTMDDFIRPVTTPVCTAAAVAALAAKDAAVESVKRITQTSQRSEQAIADILARAQSRLATRADRAALAALQGEVRAAGLSLATERAVIARADRLLTRTIVLRWPETPYSAVGVIPQSRQITHWLGEILGQGGAFALDEAAIAEALAAERLSGTMIGAIEGLRASAAGYTICEPGLAIAACVAPAIDLHATLQSVDPVAAGVASTAEVIEARDGTADAGLFFRDAAMGRLVLCRRDAACGEASPAGEWNKPVLVGDSLTAPQLGQLRFLPLTNSTFQNNALSIALQENGTVSRLQYADKSAIAAELVAAAADTAGQIRDWREAREAAQAEADAAAQAQVVAGRVETLATLQYQLELLKQQRALAEANSPSEPGALAELSAETALLDAQIANLEARLRLAQAVAALEPAAS